MQWFGLRDLLIAALIFIPLERVFAIRPQKIFRRGWANDLFYYLVNGIFISSGLAFVILGTLWLAKWLVPVSLQTAVAAQPVWIQFFEVLVLADIGFYFAHRAFHTFPFLWRFHSIHHSIEELDWLAGARVHPVDQIVTKGVSILPIVALGFSEVAVGTFVVLYQWQSMLEHSNIKLRLGLFRYLLSSPEFHHWHHSSDRQARDKNFAAQLPWLDAIFGTLYMPAGGRPARYGTEERLPRRYPAQFLYPFIGQASLSLEDRKVTNMNTRGEAQAEARTHLSGEKQFSSSST